MNLDKKHTMDLLAELQRHQEHDFDASLVPSDLPSAQRGLRVWRLEQRQQKVGKLIDTLQTESKSFGGGVDLGGLKAEERAFLLDCLTTVGAWEYVGDGYPEGARIAYEHLKAHAEQVKRSKGLKASGKLAGILDDERVQANIKVHANLAEAKARLKAQKAGKPLPSRRAPKLADAVAAVKGTTTLEEGVEAIVKADAAASGEVSPTKPTIERTPADLERFSADMARIASSRGLSSGLVIDVESPRFGGVVQHGRMKGVRMKGNVWVVLIRAAWEQKGMVVEDIVGETHGDWSVLRDASPEQKALLAERALYKLGLL